MARDRSAEAARRNARARAAGFDSYGQMYRAKRANYRDAPTYKAAIAARRQARPSRQAATGNLLGYKGTRAGVVIAADFDKAKAAAQQWREIARFGNRRHVGLVIELKSGEVVNRSSHGGYKLGDLRAQVKAEGGGGIGWTAVLAGIVEAALEDSYGRDELVDADDIDIVTATVA